MCVVHTTMIFWRDFYFRSIFLAYHVLEICNFLGANERDIFPGTCLPFCSRWIRSTFSRPVEFSRRIIFFVAPSRVDFSTLAHRRLFSSKFLFATSVLGSWRITATKTRLLDIKQIASLMLRFSNLPPSNSTDLPVCTTEYDHRGATAENLP